VTSGCRSILPLIFYHHSSSSPLTFWHYRANPSDLPPFISPTFPLPLLFLFSLTPTSLAPFQHLHTLPILLLPAFILQPVIKPLRRPPTPSGRLVGKVASQISDGPTSPGARRGPARAMGPGRLGTLRANRAREEGLGVWGGGGSRAGPGPGGESLYRRPIGDGITDVATASLTWRRHH
jgi:hypothetical protein